MTQDQALARAKELIFAGGPFIMATVDANNAPQMRWMGAFASDPAAPKVSYLVCGAASRKMAQIGRNPATQFIFNNADLSYVATVSGTSEIVNDAATKRMVWEKIPGAAKYYPDPDDEGFGVIRFTATTIELLCMPEGLT